MRKLKSVSLALLFVLTVSIAMNSGRTLTLSPIVKQGIISVAKGDDTVTVTNDLVEIVISRGGAVGGVRPIKWTVLATGLELAKNAKSSGNAKMGLRYPLWDWIANQEPWPGEICYKTYNTNATSATYTGSVSISFNYTCSESPIAGLQIIKILTFYQDKYYFDMQIILRNPTTGDIKVGPPSWANVGYTINAVGYLEPLSSLYQGYQDGLIPTLDKNVGWGDPRPSTPNLRWVAVYNKETGAIIAIAISPENVTNSVWLEGGRGAWGSEARVEFPPQTMTPGSQITYPLKVYGGPPDFAQLAEIDMSNLATGVAFSAEMGSDRFVYKQGQICNYTLNLTNSLAEPMTNVDVNVTFWKSDQYEALTTKVSDVNNWTGLTIGAKSTVTLKGNLTLTPKSGTYCLYAQVYQNGKSITGIVLLIPIVFLPTTYEPLIVSFVWNLHQPFLMDSPALIVEGSPERPGPPSAFLTTSIQDYVEKGKKPYLLHAQLLEKYTSINVTFNLQPTLLYLWNASASDRWWHWWYNTATAYAHWEKGRQEPNEACGEALEKYKSLASSGRIEILTSPYYHPIMPILLAKNWTSDLVDQLELGKNYTQEFMEVEPNGLWVPEMAFNISLVPIINGTGIQYIVLDHRMLENATTLLNPSYEPWYVKDPRSNKTVVAFFRARFTYEKFVDYDVNKRLETEWSTSSRPSEAARQLIASLYNIWTTNVKAKRIVTIATDEWVSKGGPVADKTLDNIYFAIEQCSSWLNTSTLNNALKRVPPKQTVTNLPEGSWLNVTSLSGPPINWFGETNSTIEKLWENVTAAREMVMDYSKSLPEDQRATDPKLKTALKYIYIAETSDWFKRADEAIGPIKGYQQANSYADAVRELFISKPFDFWKAYGVYILGGSSLAAVALIALVAYRKRKIKAAAP